MKNILIKFICLVSLLSSIQSFASPINKINFVGLNVISSTTLISILPVKTGDPYNQDTSDDIIQTLFKMLSTMQIGDLVFHLKFSILFN